MKIESLKSILFAFLLFSAKLTHCQCTRTPPAALACPISSGTAINANGTANNVVHGSGAVYYYNGSGGTAKVTMTNDGILDVCGDLTITATSTFNLSSGGTIQIESGATVTINTDITLNNTGQIVNRGTLIVNGNISVTNANATIWNIGTGATFTVGSGYSVSMASGSYFIDGAYTGPVSIPTLNLNSAFLCMADNSIVNTQTFTNTANNAVIYNGAGAMACLGVSNSATIGGHIVASSSKISVCLASGFGYATGSAANWGVTPATNCVSCYWLLPSKDLHLTGAFQNNAVKLSWSGQGSASPTDIFYVEESDDGINFHTVTSMHAVLNQNTYYWSDNGISSEQQYYRIKELDLNNQPYYSNIVLVNTGTASASKAFYVYPNPAQNTINISLSSASQQNATLELTDMSGRRFYVQKVNLYQGINKVHFNAEKLGSGMYILKLNYSSGESANRLVRVVKN